MLARTWDREMHQVASLKADSKVIKFNGLYDRRRCLLA